MTNFIAASLPRSGVSKSNSLNGPLGLFVPEHFRLQSQPQYLATSSSFVRKLRHAIYLMPEDEAVLTGLSSLTRRVERGDVYSDGTEPLSIILVLEGWLCRYKQLENGKRQIMTVFVPGDLCQPFGAVPPAMNHTLAALTSSSLAFVTPRAVRVAAQSNTRVEQALWWDLVLWGALGLEHAVSLGRRSATERLGFFFCEMHARLSMVGLVDKGSFNLPLTQVDLADLFGLSAVHINRSLRDLRATGLLSFRDRQATLHDVEALHSFSMFDPICFQPVKQPLP